MARFDVYRTKLGELLLDCQTDFLSGIRTRLVAPLLPAEEVEPHRMARLMPAFSFGGRNVVMVTTLLVGLSQRELGERIGSLADEQDAIMAAIDMLLTGI